MLLAAGILGLYIIGAVVVMVWMSFRPPTPDPSVAAWRIREYLDKGRR